MSAARDFTTLRTTVEATMETHCAEVSRWDKDMTSEDEDGILPTLRTAEETLQRVQHKQECVSRLLDLQGRYRQDVSKLRERVTRLYDQAAEEEANHTDIKRQEIHDRSKAVFESVKALKERVKQAQTAYRSIGISTAAGAGVGGGGGGGGANVGVTVHEEKLSELRRQIKGLAGRLHRLLYCVEEEEAEEAGGHRKNHREEDSDEEDEANRPPTMAYTE